MTYLRVFLFSLILLALSFNVASAQDVIEEWEDFKDTSVQQAEQNLSSIVIFRPKDSINGPAVNIFIDGEYQASLLPDAYTQASVCAGAHHLTVSYTNILTHYKEKKVIGQKIVPQKGRVSFFRIISLDDKSMRLEQLNPKQGIEGIKNLTVRQNHTVPRISHPRCKDFTSNAKNTARPISFVTPISN
jgi:hypothetical protein